MNTYTKTPGGWTLVAPGFSPASLTLSHIKVATPTRRLPDGLRQQGTMGSGSVAGAPSFATYAKGGSCLCSQGAAMRFSLRALGLFAGCRTLRILRVRLCTPLARAPERQGNGCRAEARSRLSLSRLYIEFGNEFLGILRSIHLPIGEGRSL